MRKARSTLIVLLLGLMATVVIVSLLVTLLLPTLIRRFTCAPYGVRCSVGQAKLHPHLNLTSDLVVQNITIFEHSGAEALLRARRVAVTIDLLGLIRARGVMPTEVRIDSPELSLRKLHDGRWNVMALAETVRQRLRPTTRVTPLQLPRVLLTAAVLRLGANQVKGLAVTLEPGPSPMLFEAHVRAANNGKALEAHLALRESLEGELRVEGREIVIGKATRPWEPRAAVRFHVDLPGRKLSISEWRVEDQGVLAQGAGVIEYAHSPPMYHLAVAAWRLDLGELAKKLPLPVASGFEGQVQGEPVTVQGRWPERPISTISANLTGVGFYLPKKGFRVTGMGGAFRLQQDAARLRVQTELRGKSMELFGQRHASPMLKGTVTADLGSGDLNIEELHATASGLRLQADGIGQRWGSEGWDLKTTELTVEPNIITRLFHGPEAGVTFESLGDPFIHFRWLGGDHPWSLGLGIRSIGLSLGNPGSPARLKETKVLITGVGTSPDNLKGTLICQQAEFRSRAFSNFIARFELNPDQVRIPDFRFVASGGTVHGQITFSRPSPLTDLRATLFVQGIRVTQLVPALGQSTAANDLPFEADISAAVSRGQVSATINLTPAATRQLSRMLHPAAQTVPTDTAQSTHLMLRAQGTLQTARGLQGSGTVVVHGLRAVLAGSKKAERDPPLALSVAYHDGLLRLKAQELGFIAQELAPLLSRMAGRTMVGREGNVTLSADAILGGSRPPSVTGEIAIRGLSLDLGRKETAPAPFLRGLSGSLAFALDHGVLNVKETALRAEGGLTLTLGGSLPIARDQDRPSKFRLTLPSTETSSLRSLLAALMPARLADAGFSGQVQADLEMTGRAYHGTVVLRNIHMRSDRLGVEGITGTIPFAGRIGQVSEFEQTSAPERLSSRSLSEETYEKVRRTVFQGPATNQLLHSLAVASLRYGPIELQDLTASLAPDGSGTAVRQFAFQLWGGKVGGWGRAHPLSREVTLHLLVEGVSLQAICDAFPPIKGYISGKINGLASLSIPGFAVDGAQGGARFWAVNSPQERKEISRTLIEKLAGQRIRYFNLFGQDRRYDRGVLDVSLKRGDLVFHELDISHTTLGIKDLDIQVSPTFNKIGLTHLIDSIIEATERIKASGKPTP